MNMIIGRDSSGSRARRPVRYSPFGHLVMLTVLLVIAVSLMLFLRRQALEWERAAASATRVQPGVPAAAASLSSPAERQRAGQASEPPAVELSRLADVRDHTRSLPLEPYCYLLSLARSVPPEVLEQHARSDVTIAQLLADPDKYRGQLLLLRGRLHRLIEDELPRNRYGLTKRYEGWLATSEASGMPYVVIVTDPPVGLPLGGNILEPVQVAGFFLCWWRYTTQDGRRWSAPVILGRRFVPIKVPVASASPRTTLLYGLAFSIVVAAIVLAAALFALLRRKLAPPPLTEPAVEPVEFAVDDALPANDTEHGEHADSDCSAGA